VSLRYREVGEALSELEELLCCEARPPGRGGQPAGGEGRAARRAAPARHPRPVAHRAGRGGGPWASA
jgi:hypothetical protein